MRYAVRNTNANSKIFPKMNIGIIVICTCNNPAVIQRKLYNLERDGLTLLNGTAINVAGRILGFVGDIGSSITISMAEVLTRLNHVLISYASTSPSLSNRDAFPYFLRVVPSNSDQVKIMVKLLKQLGSNYIQIVYSKETYGEEGRDNVIQEAADAGICVEQTVEVTESTYHLVYDRLLQAGSATTIIVWVRSHMTVPLAAALRQKATSGAFTFICSHSWNTNRQVILEDTTQILLGAFTIVLDIQPNKNVSDHVRFMNFVPWQQDPWGAMFLQEKLQCSVKNSYIQTHPSLCPVVHPLASSDVEIDAYVTTAYLATLALLTGSHSQHQSVCGTASTVLCPQFYRTDGRFQWLVSVISFFYRLLQNTRVAKACMYL